MKGRIIIDKELCKGCGYCISACPDRLLSLNNSLNSMGCHFARIIDADRCSGCGLCAIVCPDVAIEVWRGEKQIQDSKFKNQNYGKEEN